VLLLRCAGTLRKQSCSDSADSFPVACGLSVPRHSFFVQVHILHKQLA